MHRIDRRYEGRVYADRIRRKEKTAEARKVKSEREAIALKKMKLDMRGGMPRNEAIKLAFQGGARLKSIGSVFNLTRQAVSLIIRR
jgi:hypothetical protein